MSESKHTPGLCRVEQDTTLIWGACDEKPSSYGMGYPIVECRITPSGRWANGPDADEGIANARRFTAAWNACANIPTEALEAGVVAEMVVLLRKFAAEADQWADAVPDDYRSPCIEPGAKSAHPGSETVFTVGDTRKARALSALLIVAAEDADRRNAMKAVA